MTMQKKQGRRRNNYKQQGPIGVGSKNEIIKNKKRNQV